MTGVTRRDALRGGAALALAGPAGIARAQEGEEAADLAVLRRLLAIERSLATGRFAAHARAHARELEAALDERGETPPPAANPEPLPRGEAGTRGAAEREREAVAAYHAALGELADGGLVRLAARILAGHAQQLAVLRAAVGANPSPTPFERGARVE